MADPKKVIRQRKAPLETLVYPRDLQQPGRNNYIQFVLTYNNQNKFLGGDVKKQNIALYLPRGSLQTSYNQNFTELASGQAFEFLGKGATKLSDILNSGGEINKDNAINAMKNFLQEVNPSEDLGPNLEALASGFANQLVTLGGAAGGAAISSLLGGGLTGGILALAGGASAADIISAGTGNAINPHTSIIYKGPTSFRTHGFVFEFYPRSYEEAKEVSKVVAAFKKLMLPKKTSGLNFNSTFLKHPGFVEMSMMIDGKEFDKFKIRKSILQSLSLDYESEGGPSFFVSNGGKNEPTRTIMSLQFKEVDFLYVNEENVVSEFSENSLTNYQDPTDPYSGSGQYGDPNLDQYSGGAG